MQERRPKQMTDTSHIDALLQQLADLTQHDPSPPLRERLKEMSSERFGNTAHRHNKPLDWLKPVFVALLLITVALTAALMVHRRQHEALHASTKDKPAATLPAKETHDAPVPVLPSPEERSAAFPKTSRFRLRPMPNSGSRRMVVQLPYSNAAVATGTDATIRVAMSQSELLSLGFPVNATVHDRRIVADLTLGDDGLPRAVSLSLPLEIVKERK
jgi:hypothetical protein